MSLHVMFILAAQLVEAV